MTKGKMEPHFRMRRKDESLHDLPGSSVDLDGHGAPCYRVRRATVCAVLPVALIGERA